MTTFVAPLTLLKLYNWAGTVALSNAAGEVRLDDARTISGAQLTGNALPTVRGALSQVTGSLVMSSVRISTGQTLSVTALGAGSLAGALVIGGGLQVNAGMTLVSGLNLSGGGDLTLDGCTVQSGVLISTSGRICMCVCFGLFIFFFSLTSILLLFY